MTDSESHNEMLRKRAYAIWEAEGHPSGKDSAHWDQAIAEFGSGLGATATEEIVAPVVEKAVAKRVKATSKP